MYNGQRAEYYRWFRDSITANGEDIPAVIFCTDEVWFHLSRCITRRNNRARSASNPYEIKDTPLYHQRVGVWCAILWNQIIGPTFFDDIINSELILYPFIGYLNKDENAHSHFQQDGATVHTDRVFMTLLCDVFRDRKKSNYIWPPRSPDFTFLDYWLWEAMKRAVNTDSVHTLLQLMETIQKFHQEPSSNWTAACFCKQARGGPFPAYLVT
jgi:hypothetical protein